MKLGHRLRTVAVTALLTAAAAGSAGLAMADSSAADTAGATGTKAARAVQCRINFQASSLELRVGQDLVLSWTAIGADKLTASWTTGYVPFVGAVTTTMTKSGTYSYQVTGTSGGQYCGGAGVQVRFTSSGGTASSTSARPAPSSSSPTVRVTVTSTPTRDGGSGNGGSGDGGSGDGGSGNGGSGNGGYASSQPGTNNGGGVGDTSSRRAGSHKYPAQSPTGGSGVPWYQDPLHLLVISALALIGSLLLWRREQLRAVFVRRH